MHLRKFAAEKLADLGSVQAKDVLKDIAESLPWTDSQRPLKWAAFLAYWQISVAEQPKQGDQVAILMTALHAQLGGIIAGNVQTWAADELANRGIKESLPEIIKSIRYRNPTNRGEEQIRVCAAKMELIASSPNRHEALMKALGTEDFTQDQHLKKWAIRELGRLGTRDSQSILVSYAFGLQDRHYDKDGKQVRQGEDWVVIHATWLYNMTIDVLRNSGLSVVQIRATGLRPDKFFVLAP